MSNHHDEGIEGIFGKDWPRPEPWPPIDMEKISTAISKRLDDPIFEKIRKHQAEQQRAQSLWEADPMEALRQAKRDIEEHWGHHGNAVVAIEMGTSLYNEVRTRFSKGAVEFPQFWHIPMYHKPSMVGYRIRYQDGSTEDFFEEYIEEDEIDEENEDYPT